MNGSRRRPDWQLLAGVLLATVVFRAWLTEIGGLELHFDEAQYWEWSQQLDWSYYSKGPLVAWLIALAEALFGRGEWQLRLAAWLTSAVFLALLFVFTRDVWNSRKAAWWAVVLGLSTPVFFSLGLVMTTDIFLFTFWTWGMWAAWRALARGRRLACYELAAAIRLGALAKMSIGLLPLFGGIFMVLQPACRAHLRDPHLWGGLVLMLVCMSPVWVWNATHDWVMLRHELGHIGHEVWSWSRLLEFILGQWFVLSPLTAIVAASVLWRRPSATERRLIWYVSLACLLFFLYKAGSSKVLLNWPAPTFIGFLVLFAGHIAHLGRWREALLYLGVGSSVLGLAVLLSAVHIGVPGDADPLKDMKAWRQPITALAEQVPDAEFIMTKTYTLAGEIAFYWPTTLPVYIAPSIHRRYNQHDLWPGLEREAGRTAVVVAKNEYWPPELQQAFARCERLPPVPAWAVDGKLVRTLYALRCEDYRPIEWPQPSDY